MSGLTPSLEGRREELVAIRRLLRSTRVLTLTGIGGVGKTRLAEEIAADQGRGPALDVWTVKLADLTDPDLLRHTVAGVVGLQAPGGRWDTSVLVEFFGERRVLLVLDNCEHLVEAVASMVADLIAGCPGLTVLATSRMPLSLSIESTFLVPPLAGPDAVAMFVERVTSVVPAFELTDENAPTIARLVTVLEGVPLALELAAARMRGLAPEVLLERLDDRFALLDRGFRDFPARQQSLAASVDWSFQLCTPMEQVLWSRLSVFAGGFEIEAAEEVCSGDGIAVEEVVDLVASLVDQSILTRTPEDPRRYRMLETVRQFGDAVLCDQGDPACWRQRHLDWYADLVARMEASWVGPDQLGWLRRLSAEHPNLRRALETAVSQAGTAPAALRICHQLEPYFICNGLFGEARLWAERALAAGAGTAAERALAHRLCGWFGTLQLDIDYALEHLRAAEPLVAEADDDVVLGFYLFATGAVAVWRREPDRGIELLEQAVAAFRRTTCANGHLEVACFTGLCLGFADQAERAAEYHRECLEATDPLGETWVRSFSLWALGLDALEAGDLVSATAHEREALRVSWGLRDSVGSALRLQALAWIAAAEDRPERSAALLGCAEAIWQRISMSAPDTPYISDLRAIGVRAARELAGGDSFAIAFEGGLAMPPEQVIVMALEEEAEPSAGDGLDLAPLTRREAEVAVIVAEGLSNRDIAKRLGLSERTAQGHVQNVLRKLGAESRAQIATWVVRRTG